MKKSLHLLMSCLILLGLAQLLPAQSLSWRQRLINVNLPALYPTCPEHDQYLRVINDEFDQGQLDQWFWNDNILGFNHTPNSVHTSEWCGIYGLTFPPNTGLLRIMATETPIDTTGTAWMDPNELYSDSLPNRRVWPFQSGALTSNWSLEKGRYVLRCQIAPGKDMWPAFWLFGECADEIDIFEFMQQDRDERHDRWISHSVHTELVCGDGINPDTKGYNLQQDVTTALHTYGVEWDDFMIRFFTDGVVKRTVYHYYRRRKVGGIVSYKGVESCDAIDAGETYREDPQFSNAMLKVIINLAIRIGAPASQFPKHMDLDYFQHFDLIDCQETKVLHSQADIAGAYNFARYGDRTVTAGQVVIDPQSTIAINGPRPDLWWTPGDMLIVTAAEEIRILPGFEVNLDGNFIGQIRPCTQANKQPDEGERLMPITASEEVFFLGDSEVSAPEWMSQPLESAAAIRLFPNPAQTQVNLVGTATGDQVVLRDALGRALPLQTEASETSITIAVELLPAGMYCVQVVRGGLVVGNLRFVKE